MLFLGTRSCARSDCKHRAILYVLPSPPFKLDVGFYTCQVCFLDAPAGATERKGHTKLFLFTFLCTYVVRIGWIATKQLSSWEISDSFGCRSAETTPVHPVSLERFVLVLRAIFLCQRACPKRWRQSRFSLKPQPDLLELRCGGQAHPSRLNRGSSHRSRTTTHSPCLFYRAQPYTALCTLPARLWKCTKRQPDVQNLLRPAASPLVVAAVLYRLSCVFFLLRLRECV